jgi:methylmalonyl-CoA/ethylmalonyl-CoA epimerase
MIRHIDHLGIAVESLEAASAFYREVLGLEPAGVEEVPDQKVRVAMFRVGEVRIELLEPTSPDSPVAQFIEKRGQGIHHIAYAVDDASAAVETLVSRGVEMIDRTPRRGAGGSMIAFLHPRSSGRVLTEVCEHAESEREEGL